MHNVYATQWHRRQRRRRRRRRGRRGRHRVNVGVAVPRAQTWPGYGPVLRAQIRPGYGPVPRAQTWPGYGPLLQRAHNLGVSSTCAAGFPCKVPLNEYEPASGLSEAPRYIPSPKQFTAPARAMEPSTVHTHSSTPPFNVKLAALGLGGSKGRKDHPQGSTRCLDLAVAARNLMPKSSSRGQRAAAYPATRTATDRNIKYP